MIYVTDSLLSSRKPKGKLELLAKTILPQGGHSHENTKKSQKCRGPCWRDFCGTFRNLSRHGPLPGGPSPRSPAHPSGRHSWPSGRRRQYGSGPYESDPGKLRADGLRSRLYPRADDFSGCQVGDDGSGSLRRCQTTRSDGLRRGDGHDPGGATTTASRWSTTATTSWGSPGTRPDTGPLGPGPLSTVLHHGHSLPLNQSSSKNNL